MSRYGILRFQDSESARVSFTVSGDRGTLTPVRPVGYEVLARLLNANDPVLLEEEGGSRWRCYIQVFELPSPGASFFRTKMEITEVLPPAAP